MRYKALCIKQPHLENIIRGIKIYEIRSWKTKYRGDLVLCSSKKMDMEYVRSYMKSNLDKFPKDIHAIICGTALAIARIKEIQEFKPEHADDALTDWKPNMFAWEMEIIKKFAPFPPIPVKGKLGIFNIDLPEL